MSDFFAQAFVQHALLAGSAVALAAGLAGYFLVLRAQIFTADALGHVAYTGALGALAFGFDPRLGLLLATVITALGLAGAARHARPDDVAIGSTFGWLLALGSFFLTLFTTRPPTSSAGNGVANISYLFGSIFGLASGQARLVAAIAFAATALMVIGARPLLFASLDDAVAAARGVPVRFLGVAFLVLVGVICAQATQAVGALLLLGLVAAPAGAAHRLTARPFVGMALAAALAVASMWAGLIVSFYAASIPPSFAILATATLVYVVTSAAPTRHGRSDPTVTGRLGGRLFQGVTHVRRSSNRSTGAPPFGRRAGRTRPHHP
jgi:zinc/manganese transport system permease protein